MTIAQQLAAALAENKTLKDSAVVNEAALTKANADLVAANSAVTSSTEKITALETEKATLSTENETLKTDNKAKADKIVALEAEKKDVDESVAAKVAEICALQGIDPSKITPSAKIIPDAPKNEDKKGRERLEAAIAADPVIAAASKMYKQNKG
jgi:chromosome segregation ATPase